MKIVFDTNFWIDYFKGMENNTATGLDLVLLVLLIGEHEAARLINDRAIIAAATYAAAAEAAFALYETNERRDHERFLAAKATRS